MNSDGWPVKERGGEPFGSSLSPFGEIMTAQKYRQPLQQIPHDLINLSDYERLATQFIDHPTYEHIAGGAGDDITLKRNTLALDQLCVRSRVLRDFSSASTAISLLGTDLAHPLLLGPVAYQQLVHPQGELVTAAGAAAMDALLVASTLSSVAMEHIAAATSGPKWFQLYLQPHREQTLSLLRRAERAGYGALMVTVDVPINGLRNRARRAGFQMPENVVAANLVGQESTPRSLAAGQSAVFEGLMADAPVWTDLAWLIGQTALPVLVKGVMDAGDARRSMSLGAAGIVVSNHGGRSLDGLPASIEVLPEVRAAVGDEVPVLLDGGIRRGGDVFKAIALGANAVLIGRPQLYALAVAGALGVAHMLRLLREELEVTMALAGCPAIGEIGPHCLWSG